MIETQPSAPRPQQASAPAPGSLQEWVVRSLLVRSVQDASTTPLHRLGLDGWPSTPAADTSVLEADVLAQAGPQTEEDFGDPAVGSAATVGDVLQLAAPAVPFIPAQRIAMTIRPPARPRRNRRVVAVLMIGGLVAVLGIATWLLPATSFGPSPALDTAAGPVPVGLVQPPAPAPVAQPDPAAATVPAAKLPRPVPFDTSATVGDWRVQIDAAQASPVLMATPGLLPQGASRIVRMKMTLFNATDTTQLANSWTVIATVNGKPLPMIVYPKHGVTGVPNRTIAPNDSLTFSIAYALPAAASKLQVTALHHPSGVTFTG